MGSKARFTLRTAPYVDAHAWMYSAVSCRTLMQDTAYANYVLLTIVVNGQRNMPRGQSERHVASVYEQHSVCEHYRINQHTTSPYVAVGLCQRMAVYAVWTGLNAGTLHPGITHAVAAATHRSPNVSLSRVACCCCRPVSSGVGESHLVDMAAMCVKLWSTEPGL